MKISTKQLKPKKSLVVVLTIAAFLISLGLYYFGFIVDIGTHSKYFVKRDFNRAFIARQTGNCEEFKTYIATDSEKWYQRCLKEKNREGTLNRPIEKYTIENITVNDNQAFLQVELKRDTAGLEEKLDLDYTVTYAMQKTGTEKILFYETETKWVITNELKE